MHYSRWLLRGDPLDVGITPAQRKKTIEERFWPKVDKTPNELGCWLWRGALKENGYGVVLYEGSMKRAHRVAYILEHGEIPSGLVIDHKYSTRGCPRHCVNPSHLQAVTQKQNLENKGPRKGTASGVRGVTWCKRRRIWVARLQHNKNTVFIGNFPEYELHVAGYFARNKRKEIFTNSNED